jgi:hypothetical protein
MRACHRLAGAVPGVPQSTRPVCSCACGVSVTGVCFSAVRCSGSTESNMLAVVPFSTMHACNQWHREQSRCFRADVIVCATTSTPGHCTKPHLPPLLGAISVGYAVDDLMMSPHTAQIAILRNISKTRCITPYIYDRQRTQRIPYAQYFSLNPEPETRKPENA